LKIQKLQLNKPWKPLLINKKAALAAVSKDGSYIQFPSEEMKNDEEIVLAAVTQNGTSIKYIPEKLKDKHKIVLAAINQNPLAYEFVPDTLKSDKNTILYLIQGLVDSYEIDKPGVIEDVIFPAIKQDLKNDRDIIFAAIREGAGGILKHLSEELLVMKNLKE